MDELECLTLKIVGLIKLGEGGGEGDILEWTLLGKILCRLVEGFGNRLCVTLVFG